MANIKQVAQYAGLSAACVSKYLKNPNSVLLSSRQKIEAAITKLDYTPSTIARSLRMQKTNAIKLIMHSINNPYFSNLFELLRVKLEQLGYMPILQIIEDNTVFNSSSFAQVDGAILFFPNNEKTIYSIYSMVPDNFPLVLCHCRKLIDQMPTIVLDVEKGIYLATSYLISQGYRRFAYVGGPMKDVVSQYKFTGFTKSLKENGVGILNDAIIHGEYDMRVGFNAVEKLLSLPVSPEAVVCANDMLAFGVILGIYDKGMRVPDNIRVTGFDDTPLSSMFIPPLTTLRSVEETVLYACTDLINMLESKKGVDRYILPELIVRKT